MINKKILEVLGDLGVPISFQHYSGEESTYITFFTYLEKSEQHADDKESVTGHYVQIDIWSKGDYTDLVKMIHQRMIDAGFRKLNFYDLYEKDVKIYHKVMRFTINEEVF